MRSERSLIFLKNYLGDAVMATPLLRALSAAYERPFTLASVAVQQVLNGPPLRMDFQEPRNIRTADQLLLQARELRRRGFQVAFLVNRSFRSALTVRLAGIPVRVGHSTDGRSMLLTHALKYDKSAPETRSYADLAEAVGIPVPDLTPHIHVDEAELAHGAAVLEGATIAFQPGARYVEKQIPLPVMAETAQALAAIGHRIALVGGADERDAADTFRDLLGLEVADLVGRCSLRESLGVLGSLDLVIGGDTGVLHLAAGVGCPTVTVFGPTPSQKWGHFEPPHQVIQAANGDVRNVRSVDLIEAAKAALKQ